MGLEDWITGLVDGEGCFSVTIREEKRRGRKTRTGFQVTPYFFIQMSIKEYGTLLLVKRGLGNIGRVVKHKKKPIAKFIVSRFDEVKKVVVFFEKHPLHSTKRKTFEVFKEIIRMMERGEHLTKEGIYKIALLRDKMNLTYNNKKQPFVRKIYHNAEWVRKRLRIWDGGAVSPANQQR